MHCRRTLARGSVAILLSIAVAGSLNAQEQTRRARWWRSAEVQQDLQLTPGQVRQLDSIFERDISVRIASHREIVRRDRERQEMLKAGTADDATIMRLTAHLEELRSRHNIRRTLMLLAMRKALTPEQRAKLGITRTAKSSSAPR